MKPDFPRRISIAHLPTAVEKLDRLSKHLGGPKIIVKRDDQTGLALGGNKTRKLEFLVADAMDKGCDHLITIGAPQSNHCRQTAAAAARLGLGCSLVLRGSPPEIITGNLLLDRLLGAHLHWTDGRPDSEVLSEVADELRLMGQKSYTIPLGGSNEVGATGYVLAMKELMEQLDDRNLPVDCIVFASSSGGTQAGITLGAKIYGYSGRILGISVDHPATELETQVTVITAATAAYLSMDPGMIGDGIEVNDDYLGEGYGIMDQPERESIRLMARFEGILLDPVYTGRAMAGLIDLIRQDEFSNDQRILFWHTGGTPALFAYADELLT